MIFALVQCQQIVLMVKFMQFTQTFLLERENACYMTGEFLLCALPTHINLTKHGKVETSFH